MSSAAVSFRYNNLPHDFLVSTTNTDFDKTANGPGDIAIPGTPPQELAFTDMRERRNRRARPFQPGEGDRNPSQDTASPSTLPPQPNVSPSDNNHVSQQMPSPSTLPHGINVAPWNWNNSGNAAMAPHHGYDAQAYYNYAAQAYYNQWVQYYAQLGQQPYYGPPPTSNYSSQLGYSGQPNTGYSSTPPWNTNIAPNNPLQYEPRVTYRSRKAKKHCVNAKNRSLVHPATQPAPEATVNGSGNANLDAVPAVPTAPKGGRRRDPKIMLPAPNPTPEYLAQAAQEPSAAVPPNQLLVILDLNGTLLHRPSKNAKSMVARPLVEPFLRYLFENFSVMVWSSARPQNVKALVERALGGELLSRLVAQWARDTLGLSPQEYEQNVQVYKRLETVWNTEEIQTHNPGYANGMRFGQHNTVLIDDSALKASAQPHNLLEVPEFKGTPEDMKSDVLREVAGYLQVLREQEDVSRFMRKEPFEANGKWMYQWSDDAAVDTVVHGELKQKEQRESKKSKKQEKQKKQKKQKTSLQAGNQGLGQLHGEVNTAV